MKNRSKRYKNLISNREKSKKLNLKEIIKSSKRIISVIYGEEDYHAEFNSINFSEKLENIYAKNYIPIIAKLNKIGYGNIHQSPQM